MAAAQSIVTALLANETSIVSATLAGVAVLLLGAQVKAPNSETVTKSVVPRLPSIVSGKNPKLFIVLANTSTVFEPADKTGEVKVLAIPVLEIVPPV